MKYTKDGKIYDLPILIEVEKEENGVVTKIKRYTTDKALILSAGYTEYVAKLYFRYDKDTGKFLNTRNDH